MDFLNNLLHLESIAFQKTPGQDDPAPKTKGHVCCGLSMDQTDIEFKCNSCGRTTKDVDIRLKKDTSHQHPIQMFVGGKQRILGGPYQSSYIKNKAKPLIQKYIRDKLGDILIPDNIMQAIERDFYKVQEATDCRSTLKEEVVAYLIYYHMGANNLYIRR
jgi:hypothetical protein